jgi:hypothetical protein
MAKITPIDPKEKNVIKAKTGSKKVNDRAFDWWNARSQKDMAEQLLDTVAYLKDNQQYRARQANMHARMYGNLPLFNTLSTSFGKDKGIALPIDRPTMNVVQSCVDTLTSRLVQTKPRPLFLTDAGDYKQRSLAKQLNSFIMGEFYQCKAYEKGETILRDGATLGTGCIKVFESSDKKVALERTLCAELFVDSNDAFYGEPRNMYQLKLMDRGVAIAAIPEGKSKIQQAEQAFPDNSGDSQKTVSDQIMVAEAWHLPSGKDKKDGRHVIVCTAGILLDEPWEKPTFPFVFMNYAPRLVGFWAQGIPEQLMGTQVEINKLLMTISQSINLVGVPRVFVEDGSKVVKAHLNNEIGAIVTYRGTKPEYEVAPCVPQELYSQLQRLVDYAYQQVGISALAAVAKKPAGLSSGEAIRNYDDLQTDRFATIEKRYHQFYIDLAYQVIELARDIAERDGSYSTVYPNKDGTKQIDLPAAKLLDDPFVIQCYDTSMLPREPAAKKQAVIEDMQAGIISMKEGRRLLNYPDLEQEDRLKLAAEERILKQLDDIVETGAFEPPDPFTDIQIAKEKVVEYYNLYVACGLEESKAQKLRDWQAQLLDLEQVAMQAMQPQAGAPQAVPEAPPTSDRLPNAPQAPQQ